MRGNSLVVLTDGETMEYDSKLMQENFAQWLDREQVHSISRSLERIADALDLLTANRHPSVANIKDAPLTTEEILRHIPTHHVYKEHVARIVFQHQEKHPRDIFTEMVKSGLYSKSTYWKDIRVLQFIGSKYKWDRRQKND
jgi:hypothetical protein